MHHYVNSMCKFLVSLTRSKPNYHTRLPLLCRGGVNNKDGKVQCGTREIIQNRQTLPSNVFRANAMVSDTKTESVFTPAQSFENKHVRVVFFFFHIITYIKLI